MSCPPIVRCPTCGHRLREWKGKHKVLRQPRPERSLNRQAKLSRPPLTLKVIAGPNRWQRVAVCRAHQTPLRIAVTGAVAGGGVEVEDGTAVIAGLSLVSRVLRRKCPRLRHPSRNQVAPESRVSDVSRAALSSLVPPRGISQSCCRENLFRSTNAGASRGGINLREQRRSTNPFLQLRWPLPYRVRQLFRKTSHSSPRHQPLPNRCMNNMTICVPSRTKTLRRHRLPWTGIANFAGRNPLASPWAQHRRLLAPAPLWNRRHT